MVWRVTRIGLALLAIGLSVAALASRWSDVSGSASHVSLPVLALATVAAILALVPGFMAWRVFLADLGSPLPVLDASRAFFVAQLGKYVPGAVWPAVAQAELTKRYGVPAKRATTAAAVTLLGSVASGGAVAAFLVFARGADTVHRYWWLLAVEPFLIALVHPAVANWLVTKILKVARRPPLEHAISGRATLTVAAWILLQWLAYGVMTYSVAVSAGASGGPKTFLLATGGYALAWTAGFLVVIVPAGAGVRELALTVALAPVLKPSGALFVALVLRLVTTAADLVAAGIAELVHRYRERTAAARTPA